MRPFFIRDLSGLLIILIDIGAWDYVDVERTAPVEEMQVGVFTVSYTKSSRSSYLQVWDGISDARITFDASELGLEQQEYGSNQMARLTENLNLQRALLQHISTIPQLQLRDKVKVASIEREQREGGGGWPLVHLSDGKVLRTRLLVCG